MQKDEDFLGAQVHRSILSARLGLGASIDSR
jgi:hypothetical protein